MSTTPEAPSAGAPATKAVDKAPDTSQPSDINGLIIEIENRLATLADQIHESQATVKSDTKEQRLLQADLTSLKRAGEAVDKAREEAGTVLSNAETVRTSVQDRIDALPAGERTRIQNELTNIDGAINSKAGEYTKAQDQLQTLRQQEADLERQVAERLQIFNQALADLSQLPQTVRGLVTRLKKQAADVKAAADAGQDRKVFVLSKDLDTMIDDLKKLLADDVITDLTSTYNEAQEALAAARTSQSSKADEVATQEKTVADLLKAVDAARTARRDQLKPLFSAPKEAAPVAASA